MNRPVRYKRACTQATDKLYYRYKQIVLTLQASCSNPTNVFVVNVRAYFRTVIGSNLTSDYLVISLKTLTFAQQKETNIGVVSI